MFGTNKYFLYGFTAKVWMMVLNNAIGGLLVAMVIKYANNILKAFATALATVWASLASVPLFGFSLSPSFACGAAAVILATLIYGQNVEIPGEYWKGEPELCAKIRTRSSEAQTKQPSVV